MRTGDYDAARACFEEARDLGRRFGSREIVVHSIQHLAELALYQGRHEAALESAEEALRHAKTTVRRDLEATSLNLVGRIHLRAGDLERAGGRLDEAQRIMRDMRNERWLAIYLLDLAEHARLEGDPGEERRLAQESAFLARKIGDRRVEAVAMTRLGEAHLDENDYDRALVAARKAGRLVEGSGLPREEAATALLRARIALSRPGGDVVRAEMDALAALERYGELEEPDAAWQAEHLAGRAALRLGRREEAAARIDRAHRHLEEQRARLPLRWRGTFLADPRRGDVYEDWQRLRAAVPRETAREQPIPPPAGGDYSRLQNENAALRRLLEVNRALAATRDAEALLPVILDAAVELTGAERGFLLLRDGAELTTRSARAADGSPLEADALALSRSVARRAIDEGLPLLSTDAEGDERLSGARSIHDLKIRSLLAVPLRVRDEVVGAVYLDSRLERGVFTPAHQELALRLADQAAIALETARLLAHIDEQRVTLDRLNQELERTAAAQRAELAEVREILVSTRSNVDLRFRFEDMVGGSQAMQRVYHLIERLAPKRLPVLVVGESGTGKELIARALHSKSDRSGGPFFTVNCAALPENLLESELFGFRKGAFTGADRNKPGYFELAHGGTLFLDEIGEMGPAMQAKLLRVLQEGEFLPVGGHSPVKVDVRVVSATNKDLSALIADKAFREDLYYRIHAARIDLPPLRERRDDIPLLVDHFLSQIAAEEGEPKREVEPAALQRLVQAPWPGNVRELQHRIQRVCAFARGSGLSARDLERYGDLGTAESTLGGAPSHGAGEVAARAAAPRDRSLASLEETERRQILLALERAGGNKTRAAEILGINRATLFRKLKRFGHEG